jgi:hypothetical protein
MYHRMLLWIPAFAYIGFLLSVTNKVGQPGFTITTAFLGALLGLLVAMMFTLRECRRRDRGLRL